MDYNPKFLENTNIWTEKELEILHKMKEDMPIEVFLNSTGDKGLIEGYGFDFVYTSAKIEGNTYDRYETITLLETGLGARNKKIEDAVMILNLKEAYDYVIKHSLEINKHTIREIHQILSQRLLRKEDQGGVRNISVQIGGSDYIPLQGSMELDIQMDSLLNIFSNIDDPFNRALYIHNNLAYLQYFKDCNKRTARVMQNVSLLKDNLMIFTIKTNDSEEITSYKKGLVNYYERGDYEPYKEFFMRNYEKIHQDLLRWQGMGVERNKPFEHKIPEIKSQKISKKQSESSNKAQNKSKGRVR